MTRNRSLLLLPLLLVLGALLPAVASAETEPNDILPQAQLITASTFAATGDFGTDNDVDYWVLYVGTPGTQINVSAVASVADSGTCSTGSCGISVAIGRDDSGTFDSNASDADSGWASDDDPRAIATTSYSTPGTGTYYIRVRDYNRRPPASYTLSVDVNQPLLTYKPETCDAARAEFASRNTDLVKANQVRDDAAAKLTAANGALTTATARRTTVARKLKTAKRQYRKRHTSKRRAKVRRLKTKYRSAKLAEQRAAAAVAPANAALAAAQGAVPFQQGRVAEQDAATRGVCGGSL